MKVKLAPAIAAVLLLSTAAQASDRIPGNGVGHSKNSANAVDPMWCPGTRVPNGVPYLTTPWTSLCWNDRANL